MYLDKFKLTNRIALVTGGLGDLGYASIVRLVEEGCRVASFDLKADATGKLAAQLVTVVKVSGAQPQAI
jgi:NAD(P)-dependent dehydrogenase (short-subunit alcohol dehydrogenase family)